jgi:hypothetical protein
MKITVLLVPLLLTGCGVAAKVEARNDYLHLSLGLLS